MHHISSCTNKNRTRVTTFNIQATGNAALVPRIRWQLTRTTSCGARQQQAGHGRASTRTGIPRQRANIPRPKPQTQPGARRFRADLSLRGLQHLSVPPPYSPWRASGFSPNCSGGTRTQRVTAYFRPITTQYCNTLQLEQSRHTVHTATRCEH